MDGNWAFVEQNGFVLRIEHHSSFPIGNDLLETWQVYHGAILYGVFFDEEQVFSSLVDIGERVAKDRSVWFLEKDNG